MWLKQCRDNSETANWIKINTKESESTFEKIGGRKWVFCSFLMLFFFDADGRLTAT